ncbi:hypothetical protein N7468_004057 [Penicillium chermesinum]|uniref:protein-tyrosine-phosphatase n=1 Tax=Penicillium chermesinum TaxID=63820 RepID=A0A9W9TSU3_9EURO|nr:uncharacterized protein N7468_004057 [Penicillium chermesinum]KAJ5239438.1 hypothetical protein N7468_004057 [Penicillium chermesinum]
MPVQTSPPSFPDSFPSFMSVYGGLQRYEDSSVSQPQGHRRLLPSPHRESVSSTASASTESSPTTTISPFDSPGGGDVSPSSSPESPSAMPLSYPKFSSPARAIDVASRPIMPSDSSRLLPAPSNARPDSPNHRSRNLKNLSSRMPPPSSNRPTITTASFVETGSGSHLSAPPSPIQIPPKTSRRRPANLTIQTPGFDKSFTKGGSDLAPPTPMGRQTLRHSESSPSLASLSSPAFAPPGAGHRGAQVDCQMLPPLPTIPDSASFAQRGLHGLQEEDDHIDSRESSKEKERSYPDGPIQIYDSGVWLYLEPTAEEAAEFDVIVNVAKEVQNPFDAPDSRLSDSVMRAWRNAAEASKRFSTMSNSEPATGASDFSFKSAFEFQPLKQDDSGSGSATPTSPTAKPPSVPEYIHVDWDHNSEILDDLLPFCEIIDERISQGKKVLIHCQLGASRSASLVIAYGLYKNRRMDFNSMYEQVKARSQWVGPNMSLIYQLTDFRGRLMRGSPSRPAPEEWFTQRGRRSSEPQATRAERVAAAQAAAAKEDTYQTPFRGLAQAPIPMGNLTVPSSHPSRPKTSDNGNRSPKRSLSPRPLPFRQKFQTLEPAPGQGRPRGLARVSSCEPLLQSHVFMRDGPDLGAGLFSPRTSGFLAPHAPILPPSRRASDAVSEAPSAVEYAAETADPRSPPPPSGSDRLIMRNIDEFL